MEDRKEVYFATIQPRPGSLTVSADVMVEAMTSDYGNTSARHMKGVEAERYIREAREEIARSLKVKEKEIVFTSGGTESNNMALMGTAMANQTGGKPSDHHRRSSMRPSITPWASWRSRASGSPICPVDQRRATFPWKNCEHAICDDTILVSVMYVNNEMGAVEPVAGDRDA